MKKVFVLFLILFCCCLFAGDRPVVYAALSSGDTLYLAVGGYAAAENASGELDDASRKTAAETDLIILPNMEKPAENVSDGYKKWIRYASLFLISALAGFVYAKIKTGRK